jgi:regulator of protease activity HflC (stomatin/prohibitin superfamily)
MDESDSESQPITDRSYDGMLTDDDQKNLKKALPCCACAFCVLLIAYPFISLRSVPPASVGVTDTFGSVAEDILIPGTHIVNPFAALTLFSTKTELFEEPSSVPTREGLNVHLDIGMLYRIVPEKARDIFLTLGPEYVRKYVQPQLASAVRGVTGSVAAEALYNSTREQLQVELTEQMGGIMKPYGIIVENILLKDIELPQLLKTAIETKTAAEQEAERMKFVIQRERQEAERKKIEAGGIKDFQDIVTQGISDKLLQWKGIEATEKLVDAENSKLVVMGNSKDALPVLMSNAQPR